MSPAERKLLEALVEALPPELRAVVEAQFSAYNLVQREFDGRTLNFYRKKDGKPNNMAGLPLLKHKGREAPLVRVMASIGSYAQPIHAVLTAVDGRAFCVTFDRKMGRKERAEPVLVQSVTNAWRSNFVFGTSNA